MDKDNNFLAKLIHINEYDKNGLLKYISFKDANLYKSFYYSDLEISINDPVFSKFDNWNKDKEIYKDTKEFERVKSFLANVKSRMVSKKEQMLLEKLKSMKGKSKEDIDMEVEDIKNSSEIMTRNIQCWLFKFYCLLKREADLYRTIQKGKAMPGEFKSERDTCLSATNKAEKIKITMKNGNFHSVEAYRSKKYFPMPKAIRNKAFATAIKKSSISHLFDKNEDFEYTCKKGVSFDTLKEIMIKSLDEFSSFSKFRQGQGERNTFTHKMLKRFTGLYYLIKDYDLEISENKIPSTPRDFICKLFNIDIPSTKFANFRQWDTSRKTTFPNPDIPANK